MTTKMKWNRVIAVLVSLVMVFTMVPQIAFAGNDSAPGSQSTVRASAAAMTNTGGLSKWKSGESAASAFAKKTTKKKPAPYTAGEAIVLVKNPSVTPGQMAAKSELTALLPDGVSLKKSVRFEESKTKGADLQAAGLSAQAASLTKSDLVILLVKSDKLTTTELVAKMKKQKGTINAQPNYRYQTSALTNDSYGDFQWGLQNNWYSGGDDVNPSALWTAQPKGSEKVVAILDSGIDTGHPDLKASLWNNPYTAKLKGKHGFDFITGRENLIDDIGHGTHVAGIIAAQSNNNLGVSGLDKGAKIMALRVGEDGWIDDYAVMEAYEYVFKALTLGVPVAAINNSWGAAYNDFEDPILTAVVNKVGEKGVVSVFASGNEAYDKAVPLAASSPYQISVAASGPNGELADFSNYGPQTDIAAPGVNILSTLSYPVYNPVLYDSVSAAAINDVYENFNSGSLPASVKDEEYIGGAMTSGDPSVDLSVTTEDHFGPQAGNQSLKWTIQNGQEGESYHLYIPYSTIKTEDSIYENLALRIASGPALYSDEYWGGLVVITDARLNASGELPEEYATGNLDSFLDKYNWSNFLSGFGTDEAMSSWEKLSDVFRYSATRAEDRGLVITYFPGASGEHILYIDDLGLSKPISNPDVLGKYDFWGGTSMATPFVTASVAMVSAAHPDWTPKHVAAAVKSMAKPSAAFAGKVTAGGTLDLSKYNENNPFIDTVKIAEDGSVAISGSYFGAAKGSGSVTANGTAITETAWSETSITLPGAGLIDKKVDFVLTTGGGKVAKSSVYVVDGKKAFANAGEELEDIYDGGTFTTDGKDAWYAGAQGTLYHLMAYTKEQLMKEMLGGLPDGLLGEDFFSSITEEEWKVLLAPRWAPCPTYDPKTIFPDATENERSSGTPGFETELSYVDGKFYGIATIDTGSTVCYALVAYDTENEKWERVGDRPGAEAVAPYDPVFSSIQMPSLASYNGKLYLMGGLNTATNQASTAVKVFDLKTKTWSDGPALPQGRFLAIGRQTGDKLVLSLGGDGTKDIARVPAPFIFDGKTWTTGAAISTPYDSATHLAVTTSDDPQAKKEEDYWSGQPLYYRELSYFTAAVGITKTGLVFSGLAAESMGDTYVYHVASNSYEKNPHQLQKKPEGFMTGGIAVGKTFYVASVPSIDNIYGYSGSDIDDTLYELPALPSFDPTFFTIDVPSGLVKVSGLHKGGKVEGYGSYLPGQTVTLKAKPSKRYYLKKFVADGKTVKVKYNGATTSLLVTKDVKADATFIKYKTKVKLNKGEVSLKPGKSAVLVAKVSGARAKIKGVTWKSSNTKYAVVSKTGKVTAKKAGLGHTVTITAKAKDGSKAVAKATIKIFTKKTTGIRLSAKTKRVKVGASLQIKSTIYPKKGTLKALKWKVNDKRIASISATGKLTALAAGRGKYVTVTATAMDGSKRKATIRIKIQ